MSEESLRAGYERLGRAVMSALARDVDQIEFSWGKSEVVMKVFNNGFLQFGFFNGKAIKNLAYSSNDDLNIADLIAIKLERLSEPYLRRIDDVDAD